MIYIYIIYITNIFRKIFQLTAFSVTYFYKKIQISIHDICYNNAKLIPTWELNKCYLRIY